MIYKEIRLRGWKGQVRSGKLGAGSGKLGVGDKMKSYKDLVVWQESIQLVKEIYFITLQFPKEEIYGLILQIRKSAISIPSNIAGGFSRQYKTEKIQFLYIALGSSAELNTQLIIAKELNYIDEENYRLIEEKIDHIGKMIQNLIKSLRK